VFATVHDYSTLLQVLMCTSDVNLPLGPGRLYFETAPVIILIFYSPKMSL